MERRHRTSLGRSVARVALVTGGLLLIPFLAMRVTSEVAWTLSDFGIAGALLFAAGLTFELLVRRAGGNPAYRAAAGIAVGAALVLVWANLAVGIIGSENHPANVLYFGALAVGVAGAALARLRPRGMALAMLVTALCLAVIGGLALGPVWSPPDGNTHEILLITGFFMALFAGSAWLFWRAGQAPEVDAFLERTTETEA